MARVQLPGRTLVTRRRLDLRGVFTRDLQLKGAAVLIALVFWVGAALNQSPAEVQRPFGGSVPVERPTVPPGYSLESQLGEVTVTLAGTEGALGTVVSADLHATLAIESADLHRSDPQDVLVRVTVATPGVRVVESTPAAMSVQIEPITARSVAVQARFANEPPAGTLAGESAITPSEVRVSGASSRIARIAAMYATVRFGDAVTDLVQSVQPTAVDASGAPITGLTVEPAVVQVTVPVLPTATTRTVPVVPLVRGTVASGFWITRMVVEPPVVTVRGESAALGTVEQVETAAVDVTGLTGDRTVQVGLQLPAPDTTILKTTQATVTVSVAPLVGTRPFPIVAVQLINVGQGLVAETDPPTIAIVLAGQLPALTAATASQVVATVDAGGRGPGTYPVDVALRLPAGVSAQSVQPTRVTLTIRTR